MSFNHPPIDIVEKSDRLGEEASSIIEAVSKSIEGLFPNKIENNTPLEL